MNTGLFHELMLKEVLTIEEVACALAGVNCKEANPAQVMLRERDLIHAIQRQLLPASYAYVDSDRNLIDWQATTLTRQALLNWCKNRGIPLATPETPKSQQPPVSQNNSREALLRVIAGLTLLLVDKPGSRYHKGESNLNKLQLQNYIRCALEKTGVSLEGAGKNALTAIFDDAFYEEIINLINTSDRSNVHNQPTSRTMRRRPGAAQASEVTSRD